MRMLPWPGSDCWQPRGHGPGVRGAGRAAGHGAGRHGAAGEAGEVSCDWWRAGHVTNEARQGQRGVRGLRHGEVRLAGGRRHQHLRLRSGNISDCQF